MRMSPGLALPAPVRRWSKTLAIVGGALLAYAAVALLVTVVTGDAVAGAAVANIGAFALAIAYRWVFTRTPLADAPSTEALKPRFWVTVLAGLALCWVAGQSAGAWVYETVGSPTLDAASATKADSPYWLLLLTALFLAPIGEESLLRGVAFPALRRHWGPGLAAIVTSVIFAMLHRNLVQIVLTIGLGVLLAFVFEATKRLWTVILMHVVFNMASSFSPSGLGPVLAHPAIAIVTNGLMVLVLFLVWRVIRRTPVANVVPQSVTRT